MVFPEGDVQALNGDWFLLSLWSLFELVRPFKSTISAPSMSVELFIACFAEKHFILTYNRVWYILVPE